MERATRLTVMAEQLAFISISAERAADGRGGPRANRGAMDLDERRPTYA